MARAHFPEFFTWPRNSPLFHSLPRLGDDSASISSEPDPYDTVYSTIPEETHMLKPAESCKHCHAKRFEREPPGFCCRGGKTKLANQDTPPDLMRLWTSSDPVARHFRDNIRFFNSDFSFTSLYYIGRAHV